jgi:hypothetical protein
MEGSGCAGTGVLLPAAADLAVPVPRTAHGGAPRGAA